MRLYVYTFIRLYVYVYAFIRLIIYSFIRLFVIRNPINLDRVLSFSLISIYNDLPTCLYLPDECI